VFHQLQVLSLFLPPIYCATNNKRVWMNRHKGLYSHGKHKAAPVNNRKTYG